MTVVRRWLVVAACALAVPTAARAEPVVYQPQPTTVGCAAAAAAMVASHLGVATDARELLRTLPVFADGVSIYDVEVELERRGLRAATWSSDARELRALLAATPVIIAVTDGRKHTVVATGFDRDGLDVLDPGAPGRRRVDWDELARTWPAAGFQVLVVWRPSQPPTLSPRLFARAVRADGVYRREARRRRARR